MIDEKGSTISRVKTRFEISRKGGSGRRERERRQKGGRVGQEERSGKRKRGGEE